MKDCFDVTKLDFILKLFLIMLDLSGRSNSEYLVWSPFQAVWMANKRQKIWFLLCRTLRPGASRNLFWVCSELTHAWLMDGRVSDFEDFFVLFMKYRRSHAQYWALNTTTNYFGACSIQLCLKHKFWCEWFTEKNMFLATLKLVCIRLC